MNSNIRQTVFHIEKLKQIVGEGHASVFQISTTPGKWLGFLGEVTVPPHQQASNEAATDGETGQAACPRKPVSWLSKVLARLQF